MKKILWCLKVKNGIELIKENNNLSDKYLQESDNTLESLNNVNNKWGLIMGYYACYNALYSILMKIGIKCEIHDCSIALMEIIPLFTKEDIEFMKNIKSDRIDVQYYLKDKVLEDKDKVKDFVLKCKSIREEIDTDEIRQKILKLKGDEN